MSEKTMISQRLGGTRAGPDAAPMPAGGEGICSRGARSPIDMMFDGVVWVPSTGPAAPNPEGLPVATHEGQLTIAGFTFRCFQLDDGRRILDADDVGRFFGLFAPRDPNTVQPASEPAAATGAPGDEASASAKKSDASSGSEAREP